MRHFLLISAGAATLGLQAAQAQNAAGPGSTRTVEHLVVTQLHLLTGHNPDTRPGPESYLVGGATVAYRNRRREANPDYDTDLTIGLRIGRGRALRSGYISFPNTLRLPLTGGSLFVAADGRFLGASLGIWLGDLGSYRGGESSRAVATPQLRIRAGRLDGWHAQLDYADEILGFANPPARLGGGLRLPGTPLTLQIGAAIPTLTAEGREVQAFAKAGLRLGKAFEASAYLQPRFSPAAPQQFAFSFGYVP